MLKIIFSLVLVFFSNSVFGQSSGVAPLAVSNYALLYDIVSANMGSYLGCRYLGDYSGAGPYILWSPYPANNSLEILLVGVTVGFMGFGVQRVNGSATPMLNSDIAFATMTNGVSTILDCYTVTQRALFMDEEDDVSGLLTFNNVTGISVFNLVRKLSSMDPNDANITLGSVEQYVWSMCSSYQQVYHDSGRNWFYQDLGATGICPVGPNGLICSGNGTCLKGCCDCISGLTGFDCSKVNTAPPPPSNITLPSTVNPANYVNSFNQGAYTVYYKLIGNDTIEVAIILYGTGWMAFGPSATGTMIMSDVVFAYYTTDGIHAEDRFLTARNNACPGVCLDISIGGTDDVLAFNGSQSNGVTQVIWRKKLVTGDVIADVNYVLGQSIYVAYGWHPSMPGPGVVQHLDSTRGILSINIQTGAVAVLANKDINRQAHGSFMFVAWAILIPLASIIARYFKKYHWWFNVHRLLNGFACMLVVIGFILAIDFWPSPHFTTNYPHTILGLIIVLLAVVQPILGTFADKWFTPERGRTPFFPDMTHWIFGWVSILAGLANIALGLNDYVVSTGLFYAYIAWAGIVCAILFIFFLYNVVRGRSHDE